MLLDSSDNDSQASNFSFGGLPCSPTDIPMKANNAASISHQFLDDSHEVHNTVQDNDRRMETAVISEPENAGDDDVKTSTAADVNVDRQELSTWSGFEIVGDNFDKNFRPSFQRHSNKTNSMHAFHMFAVQDRVDLSKCSETTANSTRIDVEKLLICREDINLFESDVIVLLSRYTVQLIQFIFL